MQWAVRSNFASGQSMTRPLLSKSALELSPFMKMQNCRRIAKGNFPAMPLVPVVTNSATARLA
jgi:hypothetical protein